MRSSWPRGPLAVEAAVRDIGLDVVVNAASHPYLHGHRIKDVPVLPLVLVLEWMARAAAAHARTSPSPPAAT